MPLVRVYYGGNIRNLDFKFSRILKLKTSSLDAKFAKSVFKVLDGARCALWVPNQFQCAF